MDEQKIIVPRSQAPKFLTVPYLPGMFAGVATFRSQKGKHRTILHFHWRQAFYCGVTAAPFKVWSP